jgi:dCTP deaminase
LDVDLRIYRTDLSIEERIMSNNGVLPFQMIKDLVANGFISGISDVHVRSDAIDLPLGNDLLRVQGEFLPLRNEVVSDLLSGGGIEVYVHDFASPLEVGVTYLSKFGGKIHFPESVYGYANPRSNMGRNFVTAKVVADRSPMYDSIGIPGFSGDIWVLIRPDAYPVIAHPGMAFTQLRLFDRNTILSRLELEIAVASTPFLYNPDGEQIPFTNMSLDQYDRDGAYFVTLDFRGDENGCIGWEVIDQKMAVDLFRERGYQASDYFRPVYGRGGYVQLRKGRRYIMSTADRVCVPPTYAAELRPVEVRFGEFRTHSAGFIGSGWGWGEGGEAHGRPITLEITAYEDMIIRPGQPVGKIRYERMIAPPDHPYDSIGSSFTKQSAALLAKQFVV